MTTPTYLLAKFIPDLKRMEPRNIGLVLWTPVGVAARFLFERPHGSGEVDGRAVPNWLGSLTAYKQWVAYWRASVAQPQFQPPTGGQPVEISSPDFVKAIQAANKGQYVLVEGGVLLDGVPANEVEDACKYLFETLVGERQVDPLRELTLDERWDEVLGRAHIKGNPLYRRDYPVTSGEESFIFSDALANGVPKKLYERVPFANRPATFMKNAHHAAWQFEKVIQAGIIGNDDTAAIISMTEEQEHEHRGRIASLRSVTRVVNLRRDEDTLPEVQQLALVLKDDEQAHPPIKKIELW